MEQTTFPLWFSYDSYLTTECLNPILKGNNRATSSRLPPGLGEQPVAAGHGTGRVPTGFLSRLISCLSVSFLALFLAFWHNRGPDSWRKEGPEEAAFPLQSSSRILQALVGKSLSFRPLGWEGEGGLL